MRKRFALALVLASLTGCATDDGMAHLSVQKAASDEQFVTTFDRAFFSETADGQTDLVLLTGASDSAPAADGSPAASSQTVRQMVHVKVLWTPTRTIRVDSPSSGNAMIDWDIVASDNDRISYAGSCWAKVDIDGNEAEVDLREATVSVRQIKGQMTDPLQRAKLSGTFVAKRADAQVRAYIAEMNDAGSHHAATAISQPAAATP